MPPLIQLHNKALTTEFGNVENYARLLDTAFPGTPGSVLERTNAGGYHFYSHQFYDGDGKKRETYVAGPIGSVDAEAAAQALRDRIRETKEIISTIRLLAREGFAVADGKTYATLACLHNYGVFRAGGVLIGSHAYGVLLNGLGIRATAYKTEDIDIARRERLAFESLPEIGLLQILQESGIDFVEVPSLDETYPIVNVPELKAHAVGLPYLRYLLTETGERPLIAREGCCLVRVPSPERFAIHKLLVSQLRHNRSAKSSKDLDQATTLLAALGDLYPGAIESALTAIPTSAKTRLRAAIKTIAPKLAPHHPRAVEELHGLAT